MRPQGIFFCASRTCCSTQRQRKLHGTATKKARALLRLAHKYKSHKTIEKSVWRDGLAGCRVYPQTSFDISLTKSTFAHCSASVSLLPISHDAKPHCELRLKRSRGMYLAASCMRAITVSLSSNTGDFVVTKPNTTFLPSATYFKGSKLPERSSSYSR